jgi:hypothetical protein
VSATPEGEQHAVVTNVDDGTVVERGVADRIGRTEVEWVTAANLRAMPPEEIQLLAATGC